MVGREFGISAGVTCESTNLPHNLTKESIDTARHSITLQYIGEIQDRGQTIRRVLNLLAERLTPITISAPAGADNQKTTGQAGLPEIPDRLNGIIYTMEQIEAQIHWILDSIDLP